MTEQHDNVYRSRKRMILDNFLGGISWSIGVIIGGTLLLFLIGFILTHINLVPVVGGFVSDIVDFVQENKVQNPVTNQ